MACAAIVDNAVVSSSCVTLDPPLAPFLECIAMPTPADYAEHDARKKAKRKKTCWGNKKGKKDLVHLAPLDPSQKGKNAKVFDEKPVSNPITENRETLFIPNLWGYSHNDIKVNPKHHRALYFWLLIDSLTQDPSGKHFRRTYGLEKPTYDPYFDAPSDGEQDLSSEDEEKGHSPWLFTLPQDKDTIMDLWDDDKNDPTSYIYDNYGYQRYVSNFNINTVADRQQLLVALGSLSSSVEQYMLHSANCVKCKKNKKQDLIELLADSGALLNFTHKWSDLSEFQEVHDDDFNVQTAMKSPPLAVKGGWMYVPHSFCEFWDKSQKDYLAVPCLLHTRDQP